MKPDDAKALLEDHWDNFINDGDWSWMKAHGINSVRIPILYPHFLAGNPKHKKLLKGTEYGPYDFVYEGAWKRIVKAIEKARSLLSLIHISEPTRRHHVSRMPSSA